jgi:alpha-L-arabinofuranosidase
VNDKTGVEAANAIVSSVSGEWKRYEYTLKTGLNDNTDRKGPKIFVGEWATREGDPTPNLQAALGDAAWMTGMERNSDIVIMASYAPLLVNVNAGAMQWPTDLIGYNALESYGSPSYYAQVMFSTYLGSEVVDARLADAGERVYTSVTRDDKGRKLYIKLVNGTSETKQISISLQGKNSVAKSAKLITLAGKTPNATNTIDDPQAVVPVEKRIELAGAAFTQAFAPYSVNVLQLTY